MHSKYVEVSTMFVVATILAYLVAGAPASAQANGLPPYIKRLVQPESMLLPIRADDANSPAGWILMHRNSLTGAETPDHEIQSGTVDHASGSNARSRIAWEITRTQNDRCLAHDQTPCPDLIRIISLPDGFLAVPQEAWVDEGEVLLIYIVPVGMV